VFVDTSPIQAPVTFDWWAAVGIEPWCGVSAVATLNAAVPAGTGTLTELADVIESVRGNAVETSGDGGAR
jgi:hypothetical protein